MNRRLAAAVLRRPVSRLDLLVIGSLVCGLWAVFGLPGGVAFGVVALVLGVCVVLRLRAELSRTQAQTSRRLDGLDRALAALASEVNSLTRRTETAAVELRSDVDASRARLQRELDAAQKRLQRGLDAAQANSEAVKAMRGSAREEGRRLNAITAEVEDARSFLRSGLAGIRQELDSVRGRFPAPDALPAVDAVTGASPRLSIAIPGFDRPDELDRCLRSIIDEIAASGTDAVEVWVTDDGSRDHRAVEVAHRHASENDFVGFRQNEVNIGLEQNLLRSCEPCRGDYLWVMGNDDFLQEGGLEVVLGSLDGGHDVLLFAKTRVDRSGERHLENSAGVMPAELSEDERRSFPTLLDLARDTGLISGLGFISTLVIRREPFVAVSPEPYLGLTMYPQLGVLLESLAHAPTAVYNRSIVYHRTQTTGEKLAEALGRPDESFMAGGEERDARWFGASFAAMLQRVVDRSELRADELASLPERLFREESLLAWLARNRDIGIERGLTLDPEVVADADRLFAATGVASGGSDDGRAPESAQSDHSSG